ncbi:hypothetical protein BDZ97DRAFT_648952 [Flammula alnicola]|nr:hypothetical protein BDZ97DRAFT_648952 [Flammula alnicola]
MKFPKSWHDKSLLEDEPFLSAFQTFLPDGSDTGNSARMSKVKSEVVNAVKEMKSGNRIVDTWLKYAFIPYPPGKRKGISVPVDYKTRRLFVEFYWHLSRNEDSALKLLNQERIPRGLKAFPPGTSPCGAGQKAPVSPPAPQKKPLPAIAVPSSIPQRSDWKRPVGAHLKDMHFKKKSTSVDGIQVQSKSLEKEPETLRISTRISTNKPTTPLDLQPVKMSPSPQPSNETPPSDVPPLVQNPRKRALSGPDGRVVKRRALANPTGPLLERDLPAKREQTAFSSKS